jgi:pimeloyl-ACP methyl ester carboxylesterase
MGGYVALAFVERWPACVQGLILCNTRSGADTEEAKAGRAETARNALTKGVDVIARGMLPKVLSAATRRQRPEVAGTIHTMMARQPANGVAAAARGMAQRPDRTPLLKELDIPTMVITGDADELMPLPTSQAMVDELPHAELVVLPNAGHLSNVEAPGAFNAAVIRFLLQFKAS